MNSCKYNGSVYKDLEDVPSGDPCQCFNGDVIFAERECTTPSGYENCRPLPVTDEASCPSSWDCDDDIEILTETAKTTQPVSKTTEANQEQTTTENEELLSEQPDNIEVTTDDIIEQEAESKTAVTSDNKEENNATESYTNIDEESNNETITTEVSVEVSKT